MRALVIGSNVTLVLNVVSALGNANIEADVISDWHAPRVRFSRYTRRYTHVTNESLRISESVHAAALERYCAENAIDVVIPGDLSAAIELASLTDSAVPRFPVASASLLERLHDKWSFYELLSHYDLPAPRTRLLDPKSAAQAFELSYPVLVKPALGEGGFGITLCESPEHLARLWSDAEHQEGRWLAQEFIHGYDIDVSLLADHGRMVAHTIQLDEAPDAKRFVHHARVAEIAEELVRVSEFHGLAHLDMRIDTRTDTLYVVECNPRVWGSLMYSVWAGVNFIELGCMMATGQRLPISVPPAERVWHQGVAPRRMLKALLRGRSAPAGMSGATLASWQQAHRDPLTQMIGGLTEPNEFRLRKVLKKPGAKNPAF